MEGLLLATKKRDTVGCCHINRVMTGWILEYFEGVMDGFPLVVGHPACEHSLSPLEHPFMDI